MDHESGQARSSLLLSFEKFTKFMLYKVKAKRQNVSDYCSVEKEQLILTKCFRTEKHNEAKTELTEIGAENRCLNCCGQTNVNRFSENRKRNFFVDFF